MEKKKNCRNTVQRNLVFATTAKLMHPTAEEVYEEILSAYPNISKATVYRNLNVLAENGSLLRISSTEGADHFDIVAEKHYHGICRYCGKVFDVEVEEMLSKILEGCVSDSHGFEIESVDVIFKGVCPACRKCKEEVKDL